MTIDEAQALAQIAARRAAGGAFDGPELLRRIDDLGDMRLNAEARHDAFVELYAAFTPSGFRFVPFPNDCAITVAEHRVSLKAVIVDERIGQVVAEIVRDVLLDRKAVVHELLKVQDVYRGVALSYVLLNQAFPLYRQIGLDRVLVHAAMETGRWHWARLGFDFLEPDDRTIVMAWALAALGGLEARPRSTRTRQPGASPNWGPDCHRRARAWSRCASPFRRRLPHGEQTRR